MRDPAHGHTANEVTLELDLGTSVKSTLRAPRALRFRTAKVL